MAGGAAGITIIGLAAQVGITHPEPTDQLFVNTLAGDETVDWSGLNAGVIQLFVDGVAM